MKLRILGLIVLSLSLILPVYAVSVYAADINAAQMVQIDQDGTRNNVDITSGTVNEVNNVTSVDTVDTVTAVTNVVNVNSVDTVDLITLGNLRIQDGVGSGKATVENGALWVKSSAEVGTVKSSYAVNVAVTSGTEVEAASYTVTAGKIYYVNCASLVASGLATLRILAGSTEIARVMTTPSCQTSITPKYQAVSVASGTIISLMVKNRESAAMDIACSMEGIEK